MHFMGYCNQQTLLALVLFRHEKVLFVEANTVLNAILNAKS